MKIAFLCAAALLSSASLAHAQTVQDFECRNAEIGTGLAERERIDNSEEEYGAYEVTRIFEPAGIRPFGFQATSLSHYTYDDVDSGEEVVTAEVVGDLARVRQAAETALGFRCGAPASSGCGFSMPHMDDRRLEIFPIDGGGVRLTCVLYGFDNSPGI